MSTFDMVYFYIVVAVLAGMTSPLLAPKLDGQRIAAISVFWVVVLPLWVLHGLLRLFTERNK